LDFDRHRVSVEKLRAKPNRTIQDEKTLGQYENNFDAATREFNNINNLIKQDLPMVISTRIDFIDPCLITFYEYQMKVYHTLYGYYFLT
jgi:amphiphysin